MSKFEDEVIKNIEEKKIKPLPKSYFLLAKALFEIALVGLVLAVIFVVNLSFYLPRRGTGRGGMGPGRFDTILASIPWLYVLTGIFGIALIIWMIYRYTGAYKARLMVVIGVISLAIFLSGFILSISKVNERIEGHREFRRFYPERRQEMMQRDDFPRFSR